MERNRERDTSLARQRILSEEEWLRINEHLLTLEKLKKEKAKIVDSRKVRNQVLAAGRPPRTLKSLETVKEQSKIHEAHTEMEAFGKHLMNEKNKEEILSRAKKILLENKDYARRLFHGLRLSSVLHERNKQMDFARRLRNMMDMMDREIKMKLREEAKKYEEELIRDKIKRKEKSEKLRRELDKQIYEKIEGRQREELDKALEGKDLIKMNEELKKILEREREEKEKKKAKLKKDIENYTKSEREIRTKLKMKEDEQEEVNKIYQTVASEIDKRRKDKEKSRFRKTIKIDKDIFKDVKKEGLKIHSDGDKKLKNFLLMREARKKVLLHDLLAAKKAAEEEMARRRNEEQLERMKCSVERCRKEEADRLRNLKEKEKRRMLMNNTRKYYIMQWTEKKELEKEEKEVDRFYAPDFTEENKIIADYCDEFLGLVKRNRRPIFPVAAAVKDVKKEFGLEPVKNVHFLKSNVPIGK